jgi:hypothetical protein
MGMSHETRSEFKKLARDLARESIVTKALGRFIEQIIEEAHSQENERLAAAEKILQHILDTAPWNGEDAHKQLLKEARTYFKDYPTGHSKGAM